MHAHLPKYNIGVHFLTANTFGRKPYFHDPACALIFCEELEAARQKYGFHVLAFVVMPDHVHLLLWWNAETEPGLTISKIAWAVKGLSARRIVDYLKSRMVGEEVKESQVDKGGGVGQGDWVGKGIALAYPESYPGVAYSTHTSSDSLPRPARYPEDKPHRRNWRYQIWQPGAGYDFNVYTEQKLLEKANYIHANPVRAGLSAAPEEYRWSSVSYYAGLTAKHPVTVTHIAEVL